MTGEVDKWLVDRNGDGFIDDIAVRFVLGHIGTIGHDLCARLIDLTAGLGLATHALPLPLVVADDSELLAGAYERVTISRAEDVPSLPRPESAVSGAAISSVPLSDCLSGLFSVQGALVDTDGDLLPDGTCIAFDLPVELPGPVAAAVANLAARIGLESGGVTFPLVRDTGAQFVVRPGPGPARVYWADNGWRAEGDATELARLLNQIAEYWPHITAPECGGVGQAVARLRRWMAGDGPEPNAPGETIWHRNWQDRWEVERAIDAVASLELGSLHTLPDEPLQVMVFVSEPPDQRRSLARELRQDIQTRLGRDVEVVVLSAFKAGLSWIQEVVIPALEASRDAIAGVRISYRRLVEETALDLPIRWMQELFPGPEIMSAKLNIPLDRIEVVEAEHATATFVAEAFDNTGRSFGRWECTPPYRVQPYVEALGARSGNVVVTTGGVAVRTVGGWQEVARFPTDLEAFWAFWQREVLPEVLQVIGQAGPSPEMQPFFGELLAEVWISEPNQRLGVREENDSAAEALAEDIYFTTLDAIELYGQHEAGAKLEAPGAIIPVIHVAPGEPPRARITLRAAPARPALPYPSLRVTEIAREGEELHIVVEAEIDGDTGPFFDRLRRLADTVSVNGNGGISAAVRLEGETFVMRLPLAAPLVPVQAAHIKPPPMDTNLWGETVLDQMRALVAMQEISGWVEETSYQGRPIPALSLATPCPGRLRSVLKEAVLKPTFLIAARHHANEISSTNAAFRLAWLCASDPDWRRYLDRVNVVIIPYENPDGAALHARLANVAGAGNWKHHPARYNAVGFEYGADAFNPDTRFGEARTRTALYRRWLPDVVVDNHGVPSHEWVQPFAGFGSPPRFRVSYWIVQAMLYGIASSLDDPAVPQQRAWVEALRDAVSAKVRDTDIGDWNRIYGESYRFWGQSREPERFPGEFHSDMLWHISAVPRQSRWRGFHQRFPSTTVLSWVTEVNDETAEGEHLERVARAHLLANQATLDLLYAAAPRGESWRLEHGEGITTVRMGRQRPLAVRP